MTISAATLLALGYALGPNGTAEAAEIAAALNNAGSITNGLTALAGGGQVGATPLVAGFNRVTTVATIGDSVILPASTPGTVVVVANNGVARADIFPAVGDAINGLAANTALREDVNSVISFTAVAAGLWITGAVAPRQSAKFTLNAGAGPLVAAAGDLTGASDVTAQYSGVNGSTLTTRSAAQMFADAGNVQPGDSYNLRIVNSAGGTCTLTAHGADVTLTGHVAILTNTFVDYIVTFTSAVACVFQSVGSGVSP